MWCDNCELAVETERDRVRDEEEARRYLKWFHEANIEGQYDLSEIENELDVGGDEWVVGMVVDICANCAVPIRARTCAMGKL